MKKLLLLALPILLLASCQPYDNTIHGRGIALDGSYRPIDPVTQDSIAAGLVNVDASHAGNPLISDSVYTVSPTWSQAWAWAGQRNDRIWFWVGLGILILSTAGFILYNNSGSAGQGSVIPLMIAIVVSGALMGGSVEWERWNMDQIITKALYNSLIQQSGNLAAFWDTIRIK